MATYISKTCILGIMASALLGCKPKTESKESQSENVLPTEAPDPRRASFSSKDISKVEILPKNPTIQPWTLAMLRLIGTFPDGSQGHITENVKWTFEDEHKDDDELILDSKDGRVAASKPKSKVIIKAEFGNLHASTSITFRYAQSETVPPYPSKLSVTSPVAGQLSVKWEMPENVKLLSGFRLVFDYTLSGVVDCNQAPAGKQVPESVLHPKTTEHTLSGLTSGQDIWVGICAVYSIYLDKDNHLEQTSDTIINSVRVK